MSRKCSQCGTENADDARFCDICGYDLDQAPIPTPPVGPVVQPPIGNPPVGGNQCPNPDCHAQVSPADDFCPSCGLQLKGQAVDQGNANQGDGQAVLPPPPPPPPVGSLVGKFTVVDANTDLVIPNGKTEAIIGRQDAQSGVFPEVDLDQFDAINKGVSRRHCKLTLQGGLMYIEDLNSVNHTYLRQQQLTPGQKYAINDGDEVVLGKMRLVFHAS